MREEEKVSLLSLPAWLVWLRTICSAYPEYLHTSFKIYLTCTYYVSRLPILCILHCTKQLHFTCKPNQSPRIFMAMRLFKERFCTTNYINRIYINPIFECSIYHTPVLMSRTVKCGTNAGADTPLYQYLHMPVFLSVQ